MSGGAERDRNMMDLSDLISPDAVLPAVKANSKKQAIHDLAAKTNVVRVR